MSFQILCAVQAAALVVLCVVAVLAIGRARKLRRALDVTAEHAASAQKAAGELGVLAQLHERRARELSEIIQGVEAERDGWCRFYRQSSRASGVAQGWLMRDLQRVITEANFMGKRLRQAGIQAPVIQADPALVEVLEEFRVHSEGQLDVPKKSDGTLESDGLGGIELMSATPG